MMMRHRWSPYEASPCTSTNAANESRFTASGADSDAFARCARIGQEDREKRNYSRFQRFSLGFRGSLKPWSRAMRLVFALLAMLSAGTALAQDKLGDQPSQPKSPAEAQTTGQ